ncbi:MAG: diadenylate cyclase [Phycisphaerae bacterium]|nr:diadenylate cyclase [Phycisphaerae bacterium]
MLEAISRYLTRVATYNPLVVAVELILIGAVVGWVMRFLRGTRGARLVKGVAFLLVTVYVVIRLLPKNLGGEEELGWERIEFLYGKFLLFAFVAAVVAFQPELRRALIQLGQTRLFRGRGEQARAVTDALVESAGFLSRNKIGAIIAVERTVGLGALLESGHHIDADVVPSLLNTIFYPGSPLHDMGAIIRHGRIAAAGCQFPLAESEDVDPSLGSRHRAALGLAQETDAVVLVVSEETGRVSIACEGQLSLGLAAPALREMLLGLLAPSRRAREKQRQDAEEATRT